MNLLCLVLRTVLTLPLFLCASVSKVFYAIPRIPSYLS